MVEKRQLNVRIPEELYEKINSISKSNVDVVIEALELYFDSKSTGEDYQDDSNEIALLKDERDYLRSKLDEMTRLLHQEQAIHLQTQKLLPEKPEKEINGKQWWQFWKK